MRRWANGKDSPHNNTLRRSTLALPFAARLPPDRPSARLHDLPARSRRPPARPLVARQKFAVFRQYKVGGSILMPPDRSPDRPPARSPTRAISHPLDLPPTHPISLPPDLPPARFLPVRSPNRNQVRLRHIARHSRNCNLSRTRRAATGRADGRGAGRADGRAIRRADDERAGRRAAASGLAGGLGCRLAGGWRAAGSENW